jgi:hypothetical protein
MKPKIYIFFNDQYDLLKKKYFNDIEESHV